MVLFIGCHVGIEVCSAIIHIVGEHIPTFCIKVLGCACAIVGIKWIMRSTAEGGSEDTKGVSGG